MAAFLYYDTIRFNKAAGGVLNVSEVLLRHMRLSPEDRVEPVSERHPRLFALAQRLKISRFVLDTLLYNFHRLRTLLTGEQLFSVFPNYYLPITPLGRHRDSIVVVHDLQYKAYPQYFGRGKRLFLDWNLWRAARSAADVVFISRSSQRDFERHFGRCWHSTVIFNPVDAPRPSAAPADIAAPAAGERYLIAAYHYYPHKNFDGILALFERMKSAGLVDYLDITGNGADAVGRMVSMLAPEVRSCVRHRGLVSREELLRLYQGATAFISLSTFEGFNLSAAEAATLGVPLLLSDIPVHRELFADYAFFVGADDGDPQSLAHDLAQYLAHHAHTRPAWAHAATCAPANVAGRYLVLKRGALSLAGAMP
ncbi:glycosyltransferase involved in cell wall biosynthesis [Variovorax sp. SG517]|uniref:glycosyltransferase n=1 Tax=Variovorax sp. SG517 TaxID=2587117 RepID=UPI00159E34FB|nr:glycosyltransferase [Variovorax sp. SG517]NVM87906.1 glycosyltransferase involved in cell wall biosynthesis [Variovorax sp. SG517]